jgi:HK97 family phage major capsid protein
MDEKELKTLTDQINTGIENLRKSVDGKADGSKVETLSKKADEIADRLEKLATIEGKASGEYIMTMQKHLNEIEGQIKDWREKTGVRAKSFRENLTETIASEEFKKALKAGMPRGFFVKTGDITSADLTNSQVAMFGNNIAEPGVAKAPWRDTPIWNAISKGTMGQDQDSVPWWEEASRTAGAATTAEGNAFGQSSGTWVKYSAEAYKLGAYFKMSRERMEDTSFIEEEVMDICRNEIPALRETKLLTGSGSSDIKGIISSGTPYAKAFAKPTGFDAVASPNNFDVLRAAILQVSLGDTSASQKKGFYPNLILLHPADAANMELVKDENGQYVLPPFSAANGMQIKGIQVGESLDLTAGQYLVGDFTKGKAFVKRNLEIRMWDQNSTDPIYDLITITAAMRLAFRIKTPEAFAFVYGSFATSKGLIS